MAPLPDALRPGGGVKMWWLWALGRARCADVATPAGRNHVDSGASDAFTRACATTDALQNTVLKIASPFLGERRAAGVVHHARRRSRQGCRWG